MLKKVVNLLYDHFSCRENDLKKFCIYEEKARPFIQFDIRSSDPRIEGSINRYNQYEQTEYIYKFEGELFIEPSRGFVISGRRVLKPSLPYYYDTTFPRDSLINLNMRRADKKLHIVRENAVVSLRDVYETNYYHFFNDVYSKLAMLRAKGLADQLPLVVSRRLYEKPFFQGLLKRDAFSGTRIIVQDENTFVKAKTVYACKAMPHRKIYYDDILDKLNISHDKDANDRLFMTRKSDCNNGRLLENADQISDLCRRYGFKTIDPGALSLDQQIDAFSKCRYLVGIHGAGMTNMIYRRNRDMSIIEIFPPDNIPPHYYWLSRVFGYQYEAVVGDKIEGMNLGSSFSVDPGKLESKIKNLLSQ